MRVLLLRQTLPSLVMLLFVILAGIPAYALDWQQVRGKANDITINSKGEVYAASKDLFVWRWRNDQQRWSKLSGEMTRLALSPDGRLWGIGRDGHVYRRNGLWWDKLAEQALDISVARDGQIARVDLTNRVWIRSRFSNRWQLVPGRDAVRIVASGKNSLWIIKPDGHIAQYNGKTWEDSPGPATDIAAAPDGAIYIATLEGPVARRNHKTRRWTALNNENNAVSLAVGPEGNPWYIDQTGSVHASSLFPPKQEETAFKTELSANTEPTDTSPIVFEKVRGKSSRIRIGPDGSIFSVGADGGFQRWNNGRKTFLDFPGTVVRFSVDAKGNPWIVNSRQEIFRHTGKDWKNIRGKAVDISVRLDGEVIISDSNEKLLQLNAKQTAFTRIPGKGHIIAAHPNGDVWTIGKNGRISRCTQKECIRLRRNGLDLSIGPDGSVFMVDTNNKLFRYDFKKKDWVRVEISRSVKSVGVGPRGRPWISLTDQDVFASAIFPRNEKSDVKQANSTRKATFVALTASGKNESIFTFKKTIKFEEIAFPFATTDGLGTGMDGRIYAIGDFGDVVQSYDPKTNLFEKLDFTFPEDVKIAVNDADSRAWFLAQQSNNVIGHQKKKDGNSFRTYVFDSGNSFGRDLAIGAEGSVFAVSSDSELYKYDTAKDKFLKFDNTDALHVAVDIAGNPWIIEDDTRFVKYHDGKDFEKPGNKSQKALDIAIGSSGKIYIIDDNNDLKKWNASNEDWDDIIISSNVISNADTIIVADDDRPWILLTSSSGSIFRADD